MEDHLRQVSGDESINIRRVFQKLLLHWPWFVASVILAFIAAFFWIKSQPVTYKSSATILIKNDNKNAGLTNLIYGQTGKSNINDEVGIIQSVSIKQSALKYTNTGISYYRNDFYKTTEVYQNPPVRVSIDSMHVQPYNVPVHMAAEGENKVRIKIDAARVKVKKPGEYESNIIHNFLLDTVIEENTWFKNTYMAVRINEVSLPKDSDSWYFTINSKSKQLSFYNALEVGMNKESSLLELTVETDDGQKSIDLLNALITAYQQREVHKKTRNKEETIKFINQLIQETSDTLKNYENLLTDFQSRNLTIGIDAKTSDLYSKYSKLQSKLSELALQKRYYEYIAKLLEKKTSIRDLISPAALGINEPIIDNLVSQLITLYDKKSEVTYNVRKENPYVNIVDEKIANIQSSLKDNIRNNLEALRLSIDEHQQQLKEIKKKLGELPETNKQLKTYERKFSIIDEVYTFLLKKRSEARIDRSRTRPVNEIVQKANRYTTRPVKHNPAYVFITAFFLGLFVPGGIIMAKPWIFNRIEDEEQIKNNTNIPVVGHILRVSHKSKDVFDDPLSNEAESFRTMRTNLYFLSTDKPARVVLVTSCKKGEGKSFVAFNLARAYAYNQQASIILSFDLRKSGNNVQGLSNYLSGQSSIDDIIQREGDHLDVIQPGPTPPNAGELIANYRTAKLFEFLREKYETVIVDSPPLIAISDAAVLAGYTDIQLFIARLNYTPIDLFRQALQKQIFKNLAKPYILINDLKPRNDYYYAYSYYRKEG